MVPKKSMCVFLGAEKKYLASNFTLPSQINIDYRKGHILFLFVSNDESYKITIKQVNKRYDFKICRSHIKLLINELKNLAFNFLRDSRRFIDFCNESFLCQITELPAIAVNPQVQVTLFRLCQITHHPKHISVLSLPNSITLLSRLRADQLTPRKKVLKQSLSILESEIAAKTRKHREDVKVLKNRFKARLRFKHLNESIARKDKTIRSLRNKLKVQHLNLQLNKLQIANFCLKKQLEFPQTKLSYEETILRQQLVEKNVEIYALQNDMLMLQEKIEQMQQKVQNNRYKKVFSSDIRALIYDMLACQVPLHCVPQLLHKVGEHTGYRFSDTPYRTTVEEMMREVGVFQNSRLLR